MFEPQDDLALSLRQVASISVGDGAVMSLFWSAAGSGAVEPVMSFFLTCSISRRQQRLRIDEVRAIQLNSAFF